MEDNNYNLAQDYSRINNNINNITTLGDFADSRNGDSENFETRGSTNEFDIKSVITSNKNFSYRAKSLSAAKTIKCLSINRLRSDSQNLSNKQENENEFNNYQELKENLLIIFYNSLDFIKEKFLYFPQSMSVQSSYDKCELIENFPILKIIFYLMNSDLNFDSRLKKYITLRNIEHEDEFKYLETLNPFLVENKLLYEAEIKLDFKDNENIERFRLTIYSLQLFFIFLNQEYINNEFFSPLIEKDDLTLNTSIGDWGPKTKYILMNFFKTISFDQELVKNVEIKMKKVKEIFSAVELKLPDEIKEIIDFFGDTSILDLQKLIAMTDHPNEFNEQLGIPYLEKVLVSTKMFHLSENRDSSLNEEERSNPLIVKAFIDEDVVEGNPLDLKKNLLSYNIPDEEIKQNNEKSNDEITVVYSWEDLKEATKNFASKVKDLLKINNYDTNVYDEESFQFSSKTRLAVLKCVEILAQHYTQNKYK
jgi:hypothetical protein